MSPPGANLRHMFCVQWWSATLQFVGALVTAGGLAWAYFRATRFRERSWPRIEELLRRIYYRLRGTPVIAGSGNMTLQPMGAALGLRGLAPLVRIRNASVEERLKALEDGVDRLIGQDIPLIFKDIDDVKEGVARARSLAESDAADALIKAREDISGLRKELDHTQTLDLRVAIGGLFISAI
jgi:hypothetical protein